MKHVLKVFDVKLTVNGPVYIGSGKEIGKKEYAFSRWKQRVSVMDTAKLCHLLSKKKLVSEYGKFMLGSSRDDVGKWLKDHKVSETEYMQCVRYHLECGDAVLDSRSKLSILEFMKDAYGMPYVPGSSVKGMLRTILQAYDVAQNPVKYNGIKGNIEKTVNGNRRRYKNICQREAAMLEAAYFRTLKRPKTKESDAVNDILSGVIVSDSKPLSVDDLILCQRTELHTDGAEKKLNVLRETLRPGTVIQFQLTIDESICGITKEYLEKAIAFFGQMYYENFLSKYPEIDRPRSNAVWLGGGTGFVTKTEIYPLFGRKQGIEMTTGILKAVGVPDKHKHFKDKSLGVSPHICKITYYGGKKYQMGLCQIHMEEVQ